MSESVGAEDVVDIPAQSIDAREFRSLIAGDGFQVEVTIVVTGEYLGPDVHEANEHAAMAASRVAVLGRGTQHRPNARPFLPAEPPF